MISVPPHPDSEIWLMRDICIGIAPGEHRFHLRAGGFMAGLIFELGTQEGDYLAEINVKVTDEDEVQTFGQMRRPNYPDRSGHDLPGWAMLFSPALPNFNAAHSFRLHVMTSHAITLRVGHLYQMVAAR